MTLSEYISRKSPKYYPFMYLDGYSPEEIRSAVIKDMISEHTVKPEDYEVKISSEVKVK